MISLICNINCLFFVSPFILDFIINLCTCSSDISYGELGTDILMMNSGDGSGGGNFPGGGQGGGPGGGPPPGYPGGPPLYLANVREDGQYPTHNTWPVSVIETYNPTGDIPPQNDRQLGVLMDYRFGNDVRPLGWANWTVSKVLPSNSMVDRIARARLLNHIIDHRSSIPTAYVQMDVSSDTPRWDSVRITSYLINSLNNSCN